MILQSYTILSARHSSTTLFLHHSWRIGTNTNYRWRFFAAMGCPSSPSDEHSQRVWESQVWQSNRAFVQWTFISPVSIFYWTPEAFWKSFSQATASMSIPHSRGWHKVNGDPKAYIQEHNYSAFGLSLAHVEHSLWIPCSTAKRPISGISALIGLYLMTLSSGIVSAIRTAYEHQRVLWFLRNRNGAFLYILHSQAHLTLIMYKPGKSLTGLFVCK